MEEWSTTEVSSQQGGAMSEQEDMHAGEHTRPTSQEEKDVVAASKANDFVDQMDPKEFLQEAEHAYHSPPKSPRSNGHENETIREQSTRQEVETST